MKKPKIPKYLRQQIGVWSGMNWLPLVKLVLDEDHVWYFAHPKSKLHYLNVKSMTLLENLNSKLSLYEVFQMAVEKNIKLSLNQKGGTTHWEQMTVEDRIQGLLEPK